MGSEVALADGREEAAAGGTAAAGADPPPLEDEAMSGDAGGERDLRWCCRVPDAYIECRKALNCGDTVSLGLPSGEYEVVSGTATGTETSRAWW